MVYALEVYKRRPDIPALSLLNHQAPDLDYFYSTVQQEIVPYTYKIGLFTLEG